MAGNPETLFVKLVCQAYALMVSAYPRPFRERFGREMRLAFRSEVVETNKRFGDWGLLPLFLRVVFDWLGALWKENCEMRRPLITVLIVLTLAAVDLLTFHDVFQPHTIRDYLTLAASLMVFFYLGLDLIGAHRDSARGAQ